MSLYKRLTRAGTEFRDFEEKNDIILLNQVSLGGSVVCVFLALITIPIGAVTYILVNVVVGLLCLGVILLNHWRRDTLARYLFILVLPLAMVAYIYLFGNIGAENYLIVGAILGVYLLRKSNLGQNLVFIICSLGFLATKFILWLVYGEILMNDLNRLVYFPNTVFSLLLIYGSTMMFRTVQEKEREKLKKVGQTRTKLLSILGHDLRSPINTLQMIAQNYSNPSFSQHDKDLMMKQISERLNNTGHLIDNILVWVKKQMDGIKPKRVIFDINEVVRANIKLMEKELNDKNITVQFTDFVKPSVYSDIEMVDLIVRNLLSNAIKFSHNNGEILVEISQIQYFHYVSITDNGTGMDPEQIRFLFRDQHSERGTSEEKGFGIGMLLVREFSDLLDQELSVKSAKGEGTTMTFSILSSRK